MNVHASQIAFLVGLLVTAFINPEWLVEVEADCVSQDYS
jgi:hypothetical protein